MNHLKPRAHFKKPKSNHKAVFATLRIVATFAALALFGIIFYFVATQGWEAVFAWFGGKYFCMVVMILIVALIMSMWLWSIVKMMKKRESENEQ